MIRLNSKTPTPIREGWSGETNFVNINLATLEAGMYFFYSAKGELCVLAQYDNGSWTITLKTNDSTIVSDGYLKFNVGSYYAYAYRKKLL